MERQEFIDSVAMDIIAKWAAMPIRRSVPQARQEYAKEAYDIAEALWAERESRIV